MFAQSLTPVAPVRGRVLGIDPGLTRCGYAVIDPSHQGSATKVALGVIRTPASAPLPERLAELGAEIDALLVEYRPEAVAVEQVFFKTMFAPRWEWAKQADWRSLSPQVAVALCVSSRRAKLRIQWLVGAVQTRRKCNAWCNSALGS